ncbi:MAG TPA: hypothetical protein VF507_07880, partial [Pyrinomonadaceae bacterium]
LWLFLFVARRALRMAVRLTLAGIVILALVVGAVVWWWYGTSTQGPPAQNRPAATQKRGNSR